jgi:excisionase family DNA binding protein
MNDDNVREHLREYATTYPALISVEQAAQIADVPEKTIYHWSSTGRLDGCKFRQGKRLRISRDAFVLFLMNLETKPLRLSA